MSLSNKLFILFFSLISTLFCASGEFESWSNTILHHVADSKSIIFFGVKISKHVIMLLISALVTLLMALYGTRHYRNNINSKPQGLSHLYEILMEFISKQMVIPNIGEKYVSTWTPVAMTFFTFILTCNLLGLIPFFEFITIGGGGGSTVTGNFSVTIAFAIITFCAIIIA